MRNLVARLFICSLMAGTIPAMTFAESEMRYPVDFNTPIDGLSVLTDGTATLEVRGFEGNEWGPWQKLAQENEQDPSLRESNLVMFRKKVMSIEFRGKSPVAVHPIRISSTPATFKVASLDTGVRRILSRNEWGADESFRVHTGSSASSTNSSSVTAESDEPAGESARVKECNEAYAKYPEEFRRAEKMNKTYNGQKLIWPEEYSKDVRLLIVHHTAGRTGGETRSGLEMMRALYQYHAVNRGWGDIGYHYMIDPQGQIYEGRAGGDYAIGGHAYCNNIGTIGVALMGNFEIEQPTQEQAMSLQWLLQNLADKYQINTTRDVVYHGKRMPAIVGHRDILSTDCPGYTMWSALDQIRSHVRERKPSLSVVFPRPIEYAPPVSTSSPDTATQQGTSESEIVTASDGLAPLGNTVLEVRPGGEVIIPVYFRAPRDITKNSRIARLVRTTGIHVWQETHGSYLSVRGDLRAPERVRKGQSIMLRVKVKIPMERGTMALRIGSLAYTLEASGKTIRTREPSPAVTTWIRTQENPALNTRPTQRAILRSSSASFSYSAPQKSSSTIRIRLTPDSPGNPTISASQNGAKILLTDTSDSTIAEDRVILSIQNEKCVALGQHTTTDTVLRLSSPNGNVRLENMFASPREYRGIIECRVINGALTLINDLPLEEYMAGVAEEPDTEPYEKQRAFAVAARTYARYYMEQANRKFPGKPYDGSDSPAEFQMYRGVVTEVRNPQWVRAVRSTAGLLLTYQGQLIKPPYFSSDDGMTRSPTQAGWNAFPFAQIFSPKNDPWCKGMTLAGHGVGMSGCGAEGQAKEGKSAEQILSYYYPGTVLLQKD